MREPEFTQTMHIGIVIRDLDATTRKYVDEYGIGPWKIYDFNRQNLREYGQQGQALLARSSRNGRPAAVGTDRAARRREHLRTFPCRERRGECTWGVHHIAVSAWSFDELLAMEAKREIDVVLSGEFEGVRVAYLGTDRDLGVMLEIFSGLPNLEQKPDAT
jgi:hypothetical protein